MKCSLCGLEFDERLAQSACSGCKSKADCSLVKCPNCGYESPLDSEFIVRLINKKKAKSRFCIRMMKKNCISLWRWAWYLV